MSNHRSNYKGYSEQRRNKVVPYIAAVLSLTLFGAPGTVGAAEGGTSIQDLQLAAPWAQQAIEKATQQQWIIPDGTGRFNPDAPMTRGELAHMLAQLLEIKVSSSDQRPKQLFKDLERTSSGESYIYALNLTGIMNGYPDGTFRPNGVVTREQLAVTMIRALKVKGYDGLSDGQQSLSFKDSKDISAWALPGVQQAVGLGLLKGENGYFAPKRSTSRQEIAVIAVRTTDTIRVLRAGGSEKDGSNSQAPKDNPGKVTETQGTITGTVGTANGTGTGNNNNNNTGTTSGGTTGGGSGGSVNPSVPSTPSNPSNPTNPSNPGTSNHAPIVAPGGLPAQELTLDHASKDLQASSYFSDPEGGPLKFAVLSGDENMVSFTVTDSVIRLAPRAAGQTMLTIQATDEQGASVTAQLQVTVQVNTISRQFPDEQLAGVMAFWLQKGLDDPLTKAELATALVQTQGGLYARDAGISDLTGVDIFNGLNVVEIDLSGNNISKADASEFEQLEWLDLSGNRLSEINVTGLEYLQYLDVENNQLTALDVTGLDSLQELYMGSNQLVHLPVGLVNLPNLQSISVSDNQIHLREEPDFTVHKALIEKQIGYTFDDAPPELIEAPAGNTAYVGGDEIEIDLSYMFRDEDDDRSTLVLQAESPDEQVAAIRMVGQKLYVTALGTSNIPIRIMVLAKDPLGKMGWGYVEVYLREAQ
ncbi:S-layer homology domain-containing protein [Paenibacillus sp. FSL K6-1558]|uniref:S-layer homology domain-containing protein n=1 Tax=Paenibacillus sp. FSL K6-1558 TaxID=2921473 RepID=UPI0030F4BA43